MKKQERQEGSEVARSLIKKVTFEHCIARSKRELKSIRKYITVLWLSQKENVGRVKRSRLWSVLNAAWNTVRTK